MSKESAAKNLADSFRSLILKVSELRVDIKTAMNTAGQSSNKGAMAEMLVVDFLSQEFGCDKVCHVGAGAGGSGDIIMEIDGLKIMFEIKNYATVPKKAELVKFERDCSNIKGLDGAIYISCVSNAFSGNCKRLVFDKKSSVMYLSKASIESGLIGYATYKMINFLKNRKKVKYAQEIVGEVHGVIKSINTSTYADLVKKNGLVKKLSELGQFISKID